MNPMQNNWKEIYIFWQSKTEKFQGKEKERS